LITHRNWKHSIFWFHIQRFLSVCPRIIYSFWQKYGANMAQEKLRVIIGGAGIAGLSAAIALRKLPNVEVELYEQAPEFKEIGASIAISPNVC
jgi:ribulose 1,5-bisphosphate synthetase/thiazole synthase